MISINIKNIEDIILKNNKIWPELPDLRPIIDEWRIMQMSPNFRHVSKKLAIDLLNKLEEKHIVVLSKHLGTTVFVDKLDRQLIKNYCFKANDLEENLNNMEAEFYSYYFTTFRKDDDVFITFWR